MGDALCEPTQAEMDARFWRQTKLCWISGLFALIFGLFSRVVFLSYFAATTQESDLLVKIANFLVPILLILAFVLIGIGGIMRVLQRMAVRALFANPRPIWVGILFSIPLAWEKFTRMEIDALRPLWLWSRWLMLDENELRRRN